MLKKKKRLGEKGKEKRKWEVTLTVFILIFNNPRTFCAQHCLKWNKQTYIYCPVSRWESSPGAQSPGDGTPCASHPDPETTACLWRQPQFQSEFRCSCTCTRPFWCSSTAAAVRDLDSEPLTPIFGTMPTQSGCPHSLSICDYVRLVVLPSMSAFSSEPERAAASAPA